MQHRRGPRLPRHLVLPRRGRLIVSTDLHGNGEDFRQLREIFERNRAEEPETHWVQLGDLVHAPNDDARSQYPALYDYEDESWAIVEGFGALREQYPEHVHLVLGNHDHSHIGGPKTRKFHGDEAAHLEAQLSEPQRERMRAIFRQALLAVIAPCGLFMSHGVPSDGLADPAQLDLLDFDPRAMPSEDAALLMTILTSYGQLPLIATRMLRHVSAAVGFEVPFIVHGHDRDERGVFSDGPHQLCPVIFGAPRPAKRYLVLDLAATYTNAQKLRHGVEIRRLYPDPM